MMRQVTITAGMNLPHRLLSERLEGVVASALPRPDPPSSTGISPWASSYFNLDHSSLYGGATEEQQQDILRRCADLLLTEAWFIEKSGMAFAAKMVLLAPTTEARMMYSLFGADEARHLHALTPFLPRIPESSQGDSFLFLLSQIIEEGDRGSLVLLIQVVLEGWGLHHYRQLAEACRDPALAQVLLRILKDEAGHHGSGVVLTTGGLVPGDPDQTFVSLRRLLDLVRCGPLGVVGAVEGVLGPLTRNQKIHLLHELNGRAHAASRLELLESLLARSGNRTWIQRLEREGSFQPLAPQDCL